MKGKHYIKVACRRIKKLFLTSIMLSPVQICTTLTSTINFMTRALDNLTLTYFETKLCDHDKDKAP